LENLKKASNTISVENKESIYNEPKNHRADNQETA